MSSKARQILKMQSTAHVTYLTSDKFYSQCYTKCIKKERRICILLLRIKGLVIGFAVADSHEQFFIFFCRPLSLGRVNEFGVFEPIFEPDPDSGNDTSTGERVSFP